MWVTVFYLVFFASAFWIQAMVRICCNYSKLLHHCFSFCKYCRHQCFIVHIFMESESLSQRKVCYRFFIKYQLCLLGLCFSNSFEEINQDSSISSKILSDIYNNKKIWGETSEKSVCVIFLCVQSLVQNSRKAGITSAMASSTLNNEELVSNASLFHLIKIDQSFY